MTVNSPLFQKYVRYLLPWEGGKVKRAGDTASRCAPFTGAYHTNKGVTFCTFLQLAASLGITPVTYDRFLVLTDQDVAKFIYAFYKSVGGPNLPDPLGIAVTEAAWWSGPEQAIKHLQRALNRLPTTYPVLVIDGDMGPKTLSAVKKANSKTLYTYYLEEWKGFIDRLSQQAEHAENRTGWFRRLADFAKRFPATAAGGFMLFTALAVFLLIKR